MHNIPDMIRGLNIGEIGQFSHDPQPRKLFGFITVTPKYMYEGTPIGATVPGDFLVFWACERCEHLPYVHKTFRENSSLLVPLEKAKLKACTSCGYLKYKEVVGRVLYVVSQVYARTSNTGSLGGSKESCDYRVWSWEYAKNISMKGYEMPLTIVRHVI